MTGEFLLPLFVPGDRPERFDKALAAGAGAVILDLEDAVSAANKEKARQSVLDYLSTDKRHQNKAKIFIRVNAINTQWYKQDVEMLASLSDSSIAHSDSDSSTSTSSGIVLPKAEILDDIIGLKQQLGSAYPIWALIETAVGFANSRTLSTQVDRIVFGSIDFCADLGLAHEDTVLAPYRAELVLAARLAGKPAPIDGVTVNLDRSEVVQQDAMRACAEGFGGKLLIHPRQIAAARTGFQPSKVEVDNARQILNTGESRGAYVVDGKMIDKPVLDRARATLARWEATQ